MIPADGWVIPWTLGIEGARFSVPVKSPAMQAAARKCKSCKIVRQLPSSRLESSDILGCLLILRGLLLGSQHMHTQCTLALRSGPLGTTKAWPGGSWSSPAFLAQLPVSLLRTICTSKIHTYCPSPAAFLVLPLLQKFLENADFACVPVIRHLTLGHRPNTDHFCFVMLQ